MADRETLPRLRPDAETLRKVSQLTFSCIVAPAFGAGILLAVAVQSSTGWSLVGAIMIGGAAGLLATLMACATTFYLSWCADLLSGRIAIDAPAGTKGEENHAAD